MRTQWSMFLYLVSLLLLLAPMQGCESVKKVADGIGFPKAETPEQKLIAGYGIVSGVRQLAAVGLQSGAITKVDAQHIQTHADTARATLDAAKGQLEKQPADSLAKIEMASSILNELQEYLQKKGVK